MNRRCQAGFSLLELMVTLAVAAIIAGVAAPAFLDFIARNSRMAATNEYFAGLQFARSEAIKRNSNVTICASSNASAADAACTAGVGWEDGYIVFNDPNADAAITVADGEAVLRAFDGVDDPSMSILTPNAIGTVLRFSANGFPQSQAGAPVSGVFSVCDSDRPGELVGIGLSSSGSARVSHNLGGCP